MSPKSLLFSTRKFSMREGTLIDFETTGLGKDAEIVTLSYCYKNKCVALQRISADKNSFYAKLKALLEKLPKPYYAYNACFEYAVMKELLEMNVKESDFVDIMEPWRIKAEIMRKKWPKLDELISEPEDYFALGKVSGRDVPKLWEKYLETKHIGYAKLIMNHCISDVMRELLLIKKPYAELNSEHFPKLKNGNYIFTSSARCSFFRI